MRREEYHQDQRGMAMNSIAFTPVFSTSRGEPRLEMTRWFHPQSIAAPFPSQRARVRFMAASVEHRLRAPTAFQLEREDDLSALELFFFTHVERPVELVLVCLGRSLERIEWPCIRHF
jgi:hypothetical protein